LVVYPHDGPDQRDRWGFDARAQHLASRGYAVLQPNYRGSSGYNWMFPESDQWDYVKMHKDVTAATKTVLRTGLIVKDRVAIMGETFGAYLALSGAVHEPDLYKCVVGIGGIYDWAEVMHEAKDSQYYSGQYGRWKLKLGDPNTEKEKFRRISPIHFVENMKAPMFVAHDKEDPNISVLESRRLVGELKDYGITHDTLYIAQEGGMAHLANRVEVLEEVEAFLAKHL
jgi:dipeptidyl aminopeptidase/acylaminoacyl peptidase